MDIERFYPFWAVTFRRAVFTCLLVLVLFVAGLVFASQFDRLTFLGFPLGLLLLGQGLVFVVIGLGFWFVNDQDETDNHFGANEDL